MKQDLIIRHCQECGKNFVTGNRAQRFCCEKCNAAFYYQVRKKMPAYRLLKSRKLHAERLSKKETLVSLKSIESYKSYLKSDEILAQQNAYSIHELMELAGVGMTSAYSIIKKHHIRKVRFKKFVGYNKEDVNSFIETMPRKCEHWINTGLRHSDVLDLKWSHVKHQGDGNVIITKEIVKTGKILTIPLNANAIKLLGKKGEGQVFKGFPDSYQANKMLKEWLKKTKISKPFTFHGLRHTFAMTAIARGIDIYALKELMGHVNIENTLIYAKMHPSKLVSEIKKLD